MKQALVMKSELTELNAGMQRLLSACPVTVDDIIVHASSATSTNSSDVPPYTNMSDINRSPKLIPCPILQTPKK